MATTPARVARTRNPRFRETRASNGTFFLTSVLPDKTNISTYAHPFLAFR